ncbi:MAG: SMP-30/gluconolactonase/LRE family protein [Bacteroidota bacterium]
MNRMIYLCLLLGWGLATQAQEVHTYWQKSNVFFEGVAWHPNGRILVVDYVGGRVYKLVDSTLIGLSGNYPNAAGGSFDAAGNFYFSSYAGGKVYQVSPSDQISVYASGFNGPTGTLVDDANQVLYVANYNTNHISKVEMSVNPPTISTFAASNLIDGPDGLALHPNGDLISANFDNNKLQRIKPSGEVSVFATLAGSPNSGYLVRADSGFYVAGAHGHDLFWVDFDGRVSHLSGSHSPGHHNGSLDSARFQFPNGMALSPTGDTLLVTETHAGGNIRFVTGLKPAGQTSTSIRQAVFMDSASFIVSPNPTHTQLDISFEVRETEPVQVQITTMQGAVVDVLMPFTKVQGQIHISYDIPKKVPAGLYLLQVQVGPHGMTRKVLFR